MIAWKSLQLSANMIEPFSVEMYYSTSRDLCKKAWLWIAAEADSNDSILWSALHN